MAVWNLLMDLIPFEWASHGFMRSALLAVLVISPLFLSLIHIYRRRA